MCVTYKLFEKRLYIICICICAVWKWLDGGARRYSDYMEMNGIGSVCGNTFHSGVGSMSRRWWCIDALSEWSCEMERSNDPAAFKSWHTIRAHRILMASTLSTCIVVKSGDRSERTDVSSIDDLVRNNSPHCELSLSSLTSETDCVTEETISCWSNLSRGATVAQTCAVTRTLLRSLRDKNTALFATSNGIKMRSRTTFT